jgi:FkbH-like protein
MDRDLELKIKDLKEEPTYLNYLGLNNLLEKASPFLESVEKIKISLLRNYTLEPILPILKSELFISGFMSEFYVGDFDTIANETLNPKSNFYDFKSDVIILSQWFNLLSDKITHSLFQLPNEERKSEAIRIIKQLNSFLNGIRSNTNAPIIINNFPLPQYPILGILDQHSDDSERNWYNELNRALIEMCRNTPNVYCLNLEAIFNSIGYKNAFDARKWDSSKTPFTFQALLPLAKEYTKFTRALFGKTKKCLVLDCDNTLWGGVIGEDGKDGIKIGGVYPGSSFKHFQQQILNLKVRGVILSICSKNNESDVTDVFENHEQMILRLSDFSTIKANWKDKASNIQDIASELNIGLDSVVFMDDSKFECDWISAKLPEVTVIHLEGSPANFTNKLFKEGLFDSLTFSDEDKSKTEMYKANIERNRLSSNSNTYEEYLFGLDLRANIEKGNSKNLQRISQLTQKTNQFNLTTKRYSSDDINKFLSDDQYAVYTMGAGDKISDLGIIATAIIYYDKGDVIINSFMMSCRALGRGLEDAFLTYIINDSQKSNFSKIKGIYIPTKKNKQTESFYKKNNFIKINMKEGNTLWEFDFSQKKLNNYPEWITINEIKK